MAIDTSRHARLTYAICAVERMWRRCTACGHRCGVDRLQQQAGVCNTLPLEDALTARYATATLHFGEEPFLVGGGGSGAVFFSHCNLRCVFCQNHQISHDGLGTAIDPEGLAKVFLELQASGAANLNLVSATQYIYPVLSALERACRGGLNIPIVYNTNAYESLELLRLLDGIVDIYLPDMKYMDAGCSTEYSQAPDYPAVARRAIVEMYRQAGPLQVEDDVAARGLIVRHLVLPNNISHTYDFLIWARDAGLCDATLSVLSQYSPQHKANEYPELQSRIPADEYEAIVDYAVDLGFENLLIQDLDSTENYLPDFRRDDPFGSCAARGAEEKHS